MFRNTFGHAVRPFDNITRRWLSLRDLSLETSSCQEGRTARSPYCQARLAQDHYDLSDP